MLQVTSIEYLKQLSNEKLAGKLCRLLEIKYNPLTKN
jgi:hypothetical protein